MTGSFEAVVLAAGRSSRAGTFKPALDCGGIPLVVRVVRAFSGVCRRVWVVTGYLGDRVEALVADEPLVEVVHNDDWQDGMFSSLQVGVARVTADRFFVTPGDLPLVAPPVVSGLAAQHGPLVVPVWAGRGGHPILLERIWAETILAADRFSDLRAVLDGAPRAEYWAPDDAVLRDIDTCDDYNSLVERFRRAE